MSQLRKQKILTQSINTGVVNLLATQILQELRVTIMLLRLHTKQAEQNPCTRTDLTAHDSRPSALAKTTSTTNTLGSRPSEIYANYVCAHNLLIQDQVARYHSSLGHVAPHLAQVAQH